MRRLIVQQQIADTMSPSLSPVFSPDAVLLFLALAAAACRDSPLWLASDPVITQGCPPFIRFFVQISYQCKWGWRGVHPRTLWEMRYFWRWDLCIGEIKAGRSALCWMHHYNVDLLSFALSLHYFSKTALSTLENTWGLEESDSGSGHGKSWMSPKDNVFDLKIKK